ncbi:MAG: 3-hydroxyacyl-CoA dehydrogenase [bacterium]|nr:3-hydroxyacyl-CoA dehydrogenase [bacterium]
MKIDDIRKVLILGAGTMGQQIGWQCAKCGFDVMLYDTSEEIIADAEKRVKKICDNNINLKLISTEDADAVMSRISFSCNPEEAAKDADIISESVPEDPKIKGIVFEQFNRLCPDHTIFTTNTSSLVPSDFADATGRPEKLIALHFHDIRISKIVDVMPHEGTSKETIDLTTAFAQKIDQIPIVLQKEQHGYVFNTMLMSFTKTALSLAAKGIASVEDIDRSWMGVMHTPMGPFGIMDQVGLGTVWKVTDYWAEKLDNDGARACAEFVKKYIDQGLLGAKTNKGFYSYPNPAYGQNDFLTGKK